MNVRRIVLDVDKAADRPSIPDIAEAISACAGVEACNITVNEIDVETVGMNVTIEGSGLDLDVIRQAIERSGAAVHSLDQFVFGDRMVENIPRAR
ncbi:MAG TPA: DUF211 domain-containing protein [Bauldia sp.]|nr:DUF211 domain-containing protein [Bauldia sp.]